MVRALILFTKESINNRQAFPEKLKALLEEQAGGELSVDVATYDDLSYALTSGNQIVTVHSTGRNLDAYDVVYLRRIIEATAQAIAIGTYCKSKGIAVIDTEIAIRPGSMGKLTQYMKMSLSSLPFPDTVYASSHKHLLEAFAAHPLPFPVILKSVSGRRGSDNYLISSQAELEARLDAQPDTHFLIQAHVPNTGDYRVWIAGGTVGPVLYRSRESGHLNNTSQGSAAEIVPVESLPANVRAECIRATEIFCRDVAGVDLVFENDDTKGKYYFFEVNRAPQIENTPHESVKASALADYMLSIANPRRS
jgi:glutathione synthase/RimK-type ligase-like ATP-grasp enzyme